jgi:uncharacterized membrane protein
MDISLALHIVCGVLMVAIGYLYKRFPPKTINNLYGYRTPRSMRTQAAWHRANAYCSGLMFTGSLLILPVQVLLYVVFDGATSLLIYSAVLCGALVCLLPVVEKNLKKNGF